MKRHEEALQTAVCRYLDLQYNHVIYISDHSGIKMTIGQAKKAKQQRCKNYRIPDLLILHPSNGYHGLCMELKKDMDEVFCKDGTIRKSEHIQEQAEALEVLRERGYKALFVCGFDHAKLVIDTYFKNLS